MKLADQDFSHKFLWLFLQLITAGTFWIMPYTAVSSAGMSDW